MRIRNIEGLRFGRLLALARVRTVGHNSLWRCNCDCGNVVEIRLSNLVNGTSKSCGCYASELTSARNLKGRHSHTRKGWRSPTYLTWEAMRRRCDDPENISYARYGGRGITYPRKWIKFENFLRDMGERPPNKTLDRKNNDRNYSKSNCRWATRSEQRLNQSYVHKRERQGRYA
jgi:hypothetical protein